ncbi:MAG: hypothetical protein MI723_02380 [Caulobacterales bacterium]|nr:hypothetical protein [Caulobacterales bacterium]
MSPGLPPRPTTSRPARLSRASSPRARRSPFTVAALSLALVLASSCASGGLLGGRGDGLSAADLAPPPARLPPPESVGAGALLGGASFDASDATADWGEGYLQASGPGAAWEAVSFPLFDAPDGRHWGWVVEGRGYDQERRVAAPPRGNVLVSVPGAGRSFLVLQEGEGGWLRVRWGEPDDPREGVGWTHPRLAQARRLIYTPWSAEFAGAAGLVFRNAAAAHNLRAGPSLNEHVIERLEGDRFDLGALAIRGDWMRVRVSVPPACGGGDDPESQLLGTGIEARTLEGWVRWRSARRGPWVTRTASAAVCGRVS